LKRTFPKISSLASKVDGSASETAEDIEKLKEESPKKKREDNEGDSDHGGRGAWDCFLCALSDNGASKSGSDSSSVGSDGGAIGRDFCNSEACDRAFGI
jgi:hypothetical protein